MYVHMRILSQTKAVHFRCSCNIWSPSAWQYTKKLKYTGHFEAFFYHFIEYIDIIYSRGENLTHEKNGELNNIENKTRRKSGGLVLWTQLHNAALISFTCSIDYLFCQESQSYFSEIVHFSKMVDFSGICWFLLNGNEINPDILL